MSYSFGILIITKVHSYRMMDRSGVLVLTQRRCISVAYLPSAIPLWVGTGPFPKNATWIEKFNSEAWVTWLIYFHLPDDIRELCLSIYEYQEQGWSSDATMLTGRTGWVHVSAILKAFESF
jgi:hypothetical protein